MEVAMMTEEGGGINLLHIEIFVEKIIVKLGCQPKLFALLQQCNQTSLFFLRVCQLFLKN